jgi:hypothetical protein
MKQRAWLDKSQTLNKKRSSGWARSNGQPRTAGNANGAPSRSLENSVHRFADLLLAGRERRLLRDLQQMFGPDQPKRLPALTVSVGGFVVARPANFIASSLYFFCNRRYRRAIRRGVGDRLWPCQVIAELTSIDVRSACRPAVQVGDRISVSAEQIVDRPGALADGKTGQTCSLQRAAL